MHLIPEAIERYCLDHSRLPSEVCRSIEEYTRAHVPMAQMVTGPLVGSLLGLMVGIIRARRVLEVGCFTGYSALAMAERLPEGGELVTLEIDADRLAIAKRFWGQSPHGKKIMPVLGPAEDSLSRLKGPFDLVFIDADKGGYLSYLKTVLPMLGENGLVIADNTLWSGRVLTQPPPDPDTAAIQTFNGFVKGHPELESTLLPVRDGLLLIRKKSG